MTLSHYFLLHVYYNFLLYLLSKPTTIDCNIIIEDSGIEGIDDNDIAIIFYLTIRNINKYDININVEMIKCDEIGYGYNDDHMLLLGGNMGIFQYNKLKNATLIYPNIYVKNRVGKCLILVQYHSDQDQGEIQQQIDFDTRSNRDRSCLTHDLNVENSCKPIDCVIKYSSKRSYFNRQTKICEPAVSCPFGLIYLPNTNECRNINELVTKQDLEELEDGQYETDNIRIELCHHGKIDPVTGNCYCNNGWITSPHPEITYQPNLAIYHMCNIQLTSWQESNREKLILTILAIFIFSLAIMVKMLLAIYFLKWCYNWIQQKVDKRKATKKVASEHNLETQVDAAALSEDVWYSTDHEDEHFCSASQHLP